jgi:hypothetical protein
MHNIRNCYSSEELLLVTLPTTEGKVTGIEKIRSLGLYVREPLSVSALGSMFERALICCRVLLWIASHAIQGYSRIDG